MRLLNKNFLLKLILLGFLNATVSAGSCLARELVGLVIHLNKSEFVTIRSPLEFNLN